jgi:hypothetical protein
MCSQSSLVKIHACLHNIELSTLKVLQVVDELLFCEAIEELITILSLLVFLNYGFL